ncbi:MAG: 3D domain-containing protein [Romboutsia sp.]|uniref:3D domain-containing protein n=1 Tax=Romboutsia sp. TaxID=1965302 RepID=UPI003F34775A
MKEGKVIIAGVIGVCIMSISLAGYWTLKKEQLSIVVKGEEKKVSTFKKTVKELLDEAKITYDEDDEITPSLDTQLVDYMDIKVVEIKKLTQKEYENIPFEVKLVEDKELEIGSSKVTQEGKEGKKELVYELTYKDGELSDKSLVKESISESATDKIVKKGIKEKKVVASKGLNSRQMSVVATAYSGDGITSTGTVPKWGTIAVDPRVIPYGSKVYIPKFGMTFIAEDCGGAIKGNKIDIFMNSESQCRNWGRRSIDIYVTT